MRAPTGLLDTAFPQASSHHWAPPDYSLKSVLRVRTNRGLRCPCGFLVIVSYDIVPVAAPAKEMAKAVGA